MLTEITDLVVFRKKLLKFRQVALVSVEFSALQSLVRYTLHEGHLTRTDIWWLLME